MKTLFRLLTIALLASLLALVGCAKKPPACSAPETVNLIREIAVTNAQKIQLTPTGALLMWGDPQGVAPAFFQALKVELSNVVMDGYDEKARKNTCNGEFKATTAAGSTLTREINYTVQLTEDQGDNNFIVAIEAFQPIVSQIAGDLADHFRQKRFVGEWAGTYSCDGMIDEKDGPRGPFSMPVTAIVDANLRPKLERTTVGGGVEKLAGLITDESVWLRGSGRNSPDDTWNTEFTGKIDGFQYTARGFIKSPEGGILRVCQLALTLPGAK